MIKVRDEKYLQAFGANLKRLRHKQGISQETLNLEAGISKNQVGLIESGKVNVSLSTIKCLAKALKVHPKDLLNF